MEWPHRSLAQIRLKDAYVNETGKGLNLVQEAGSEAASAINGVASAVGAGLKVGTKAVKEFTKATEQNQQPPTLAPPSPPGDQNDPTETF